METVVGAVELCVEVPDDTAVLVAEVDTVVEAELEAVLEAVRVWVVVADADIVVEAETLSVDE